jgi:hypothetical protein
VRCGAGCRPAPTWRRWSNDRYDAVTIAAVADDEATLRVLLAGGASARLTTSRYDGTALIAAPPTWGTTAWCASSSRPARRWTM